LHEHEMATNEAGKLLMQKDLGKYVGAAALLGFVGASDSFLLASDFSARDERSQNLVDA